jgi:hypothetical protein
MIRPFLTEAVLFLTPFAVYAVFLLVMRRGLFDGASWPLPRLLWLTIAAFALVIGSFIVLAHFGGSKPGSTYVPAHIENGKFVPGTSK